MFPERYKLEFYFPNIFRCQDSEKFSEKIIAARKKFTAPFWKSYVTASKNDQFPGSLSSRNFLWGSCEKPRGSVVTLEVITRLYMPLLVMYEQVRAILSIIYAGCRLFEKNLLCPVFFSFSVSRHKFAFSCIKPRYIVEIRRGIRI